jgi:hypothetical protein
MYKTSNLSLWLTEAIMNSSEQYDFRLLKSSKAISEDAMGEIKTIVNKAHEDARKYLRTLAGMSLDPLSEKQIFDPAAGYPESLDIQTLKGYFGEILTGVVAVNYSHFGETVWEVPVALFRFHDLAFDQIGRLSQGTANPKKIPGRTGDDNLAFVRDENGFINKILFCEAKCTADHDSTLISDAHEKVSEANLIPVSIKNLIDILRDYDDVNSKEWIYALRHLWLSSKNPTSKRFDLVCYACGREPARTSQKSWISSNQPHSSYTAGRFLEAIEIHLHSVEELIQEVYGKRERQNEPI